MPHPNTGLTDITYRPDNLKSAKDDLPDGLLFNLRRQKTKYRYFFLNGRLHKKVSLNRGLDIISAWSYDTNKIVNYPYSAVKNQMKPGYYTKEACALLNRHRVTVVRAIYDGKIDRPQRAWVKSIPIEKRDETATTTGLYIWSEEDILNAHTYFANQYIGTLPRDERVKTPPKTLRNRREVKAMLNNQEVFYARTKDGEFVPIWKAPEW